MQFGARKGISTVDALTYATLGLRKTAERFGVSHAVFLDISKAFDRVNHLLLIRKLLDLGINHVLIRWIFFFLTSRKQRVKIGGDKSDWFEISSGLPQGTVLGPLLWLIFCNDCPLDSIRKQASLTDQTERAGLFVDDMFMYSSGSENEQIQDLNQRLEKLYLWSNEWGVDFNVSKTKHMKFTGKRRVRSNKRRKVSHRSAQKLVFGGEILETVPEYKYLGILFTPSLKFDRHILELILPRAKQVSGQIRHLLSKLSGRVTFLRVLWQSRIRPILEYGSSVWSCFVDKSTLVAIDNFQMQYFRRAIGMPKKTSLDALLCDISVLKQSFRFERERAKLKVKLDLDLCPPVVQRQVKSYETSDKKFVKYFYGPSKEQAAKLRSEFVDDFPSRVVVPKRETFVNYANSLSRQGHNTDSGYRLVYKRECATDPWRADLKVKGNPKFPSVPESQYEVIKQYAFEEREKSLKANTPLTSMFKKIFAPFLTRAYETIQWSRFTSTPRCKTLREFRCGWYHDRLLHQLKDPYMRIIRKCRLERSELALHSFYRNPKASKICKCCDMKVEESLSHFFLECPAFVEQRSSYFTLINPILKELDVPQNHVKSFLGFNDHMTSREYCFKTRCLRRRLYEHTCNFIRNTKRFKFV